MMEKENMGYKKCFIKWQKNIQLQLFRVRYDKDELSFFQLK